MFGTLFWICLFSGLISVFSPCLSLTVSYVLNCIELIQCNLPVESAYWVSVCSCSWHAAHSFRSTERQLSNSPEQIRADNMAIQKLVQGGSVLKLESSALTNNRKGQGPESTRVPPTLTFLRSSLLGVLLRFSEHPTGDIKEMFQQVCLLPLKRIHAVMSGVMWG